MINHTKYIVIIGAGFGGITALRHLVNKLPSGYSITVVDRHRHQLYTPFLYEIASIPHEVSNDSVLKSCILIPLDQTKYKKHNASFLQDEFEAIDLQNKTIRLKSAGEMPYDYIIFALGSETAYCNIPGLQEYGYPLKTFDDAVRMRNAVENLLKRKDELRITVGGAGSSGVELVAEFVNFICIMKEKLVPQSNTCSVFFTLIEASPDILPGFDSWVIEKTKKRLKKLGISVRVNSAITSVTKDTIILKNGDTLANDILIWTGGVKGPTLCRSLGLEISPRDSLIVDEYLRVYPLTTYGVEAKHPSNSIFAIGDNATVMNPATQKPVIWNVPAAEAEAKVTAENIIRAIQEKPLIPFKPTKKYPFVLAVGKKYAIADLGIRFSGFIGWITKQIIELNYVMSVLPMTKAISFWWRSFRASRVND